MATSAATLSSRLEAAETAYDEMMVNGRAVVEYREPSTGLSVRKDATEMRKYIDYLRERVSAVAAAASRTGNTTYGTIRRPT